MRSRRPRQAVRQPGHRYERTVRNGFLATLDLCQTPILSGPRLQGLMHPLLPSLIAAVLYLGTAAYQGACVSKRTAPGKPLLLLFGLLALVAHAFSLYQQLLTPAGLVLDFFNAASLIAAAVILLTLLATLRIPVENLLLLLFPLGALTTLWRYSSPTAPSSRSTNNQASWPTSCSRSWPTACSPSRCSRRSCCCSRITASSTSIRPG